MVSEFKIYLDEKDIEELKSSVEISIDTMIDSKKPICRVTLVWDPRHIYCEPPEEG